MRLALSALVTVAILFHSHCFAAADIADATESLAVDKLKQLLAQNRDINAAQADGTTALHWAAYHDDTQIAETLLAAGAKVNVRNHFRISPLILACQNGNEAIVKLLLANGSDPNQSYAGGETALMTAARTGIAGVVQALLSAGADVNTRDDNQQTAIMWAAAEGHLSVVELLLEAKADYSHTLASGFNALFFAAREGKTDVALRLIKAGIDVNSVITPADDFRLTNKTALKGSSPLILAIENGHFELAAELLAIGADPNDQRSGFAPLHTITWVRKPHRGDDQGDPKPIGSGQLTSVELIKILIEKGADVNLRLKTGKPAKGARVTWKGASPFFMAAKRADLEMMKILKDSGADPFLVNDNNTTPLMVTAGLGTHAAGEEAGTEEEVLAALSYLIDLGADVNAINKRNETAMHGASYKNLPKVIELLASKGADVNVWNINNSGGWTPLLIAQGFRPGNYKPSQETTAAISAVMLAQGVTPPPAPPIPQ